MINLKDVFKKYITIFKSNRMVTAFEDDLIFLEDKNSSELSKIKKLGTDYLKESAVIRLHRKYMIKEAMLDKDNELFNQYDPRALNAMLNFMFDFDKDLLIDIESEMVNKGKKK